MLSWEGLCLLTLVADWGIWANDWLGHVRSLILRQESRCNFETADMVFVWQRKYELLCVVIDGFDLLQLQADPALVTTGQGGLGWASDFGLNGVLDTAALAIVIIAAASGSRSCNGAVQQGIGRTTGCWLSGIASALLTKLSIPRCFPKLKR